MNVSCFLTCKTSFVHMEQIYVLSAYMKGLKCRDEGWLSYE